MTEETQGVETAHHYYGSSQVDGFYSAVWGGESIHTGSYLSEHESIATASRRTIERAAERIAERLGRPGTTVLDLGSGYGGPTRYLAETFGCRVVALNISESQNERHRRTNAERGLDGLIEVVTGSFQDIPFPDAEFDVVWSQEAFCHSPDRDRLLAEAARVLRPHGDLVFTDVMAADGVPPEALHQVIERLRVPDLATPGYYRRRLAELGLSHLEFDQQNGQLRTHYERLTEETRSRQDQLRRLVGPDYLAELLANLPLWVDACRDGRLSWGVFHARR
ncbi:SAM-dependent methyltransferase [Kitasatospora viridis]|uniref:Sarcosine/dimethylglycine N-methyltransferase n=1 Tax=Kitasatospora viridis TaxID=281105 RepID=A0A561UQA0_9ACTN|nr:class I SAM-dependent methyltransferase [Kitasatospora viridis]TWG01535.1 sarcosine/dimethylglycine N-methyltransferase [Kitasatospora viridis]